LVSFDGEDRISDRPLSPIAASRKLVTVRLSTGLDGETGDSFAAETPVSRNW